MIIFSLFIGRREKEKKRKNREESKGNGTSRLASPTAVWQRSRTESARNENSGHKAVKKGLDHMKWTQEYRSALEKFWTAMSDFPDLTVVFNALCKRCKQRSRNWAANSDFFLPCEECRSRINLLRPAVRSAGR